MADTVLSFPTYFPKGCPPAEAIDEECLLYRLCKRKELSEDDFTSFYLINPEKHKDNINAYGLSVFRTANDCLSVRNKAPKLRKKYKHIASGWTNKFRGKILNTPSNASPAHFTWWVYEGVYPHTFFEIYDEGGGISE